MLGAVPPAGQLSEKGAASDLITGPSWRAGAAGAYGRRGIGPDRGGEASGMPDHMERSGEARIDILSVRTFLGGRMAGLRASPPPQLAAIYRKFPGGSEPPVDA